MRTNSELQITTLLEAEITMEQSKPSIVLNSEQEDLVRDYIDMRRRTRQSVKTIGIGTLLVGVSYLLMCSIATDAAVPKIFMSMAKWGFYFALALAIIGQSLKLWALAGAKAQLIASGLPKSFVDIVSKINLRDLDRANAEKEKQRTEQLK
jgi:hypothetical protein